MDRRSFLRVVGGAVGGAALGVQGALAAEGPGAEVAGLPRRMLGRTGERVSVIGFPGLSLVHGDQARCTAAIHDAFARGVNYFDVAPAYGDGACETKMGIGLEGIDRSRIFLACKTKRRDKKGAREELEQSLKRLKTDRFDLYQLHALMKPADAEQALGPGGAAETLLEAKAEGKVRFFGFSAHTTKAALAAMRGFRFDTVMFPINFVELLTWDFGKAVLALAKEQGAAVLAIKPMCRGKWQKGVQPTRPWWYRCVEDEKEIDLALRFTLSQEGVAAGLPPAWLDLLDKAIEAGRRLRRLTVPETDELKKLAGTCLSVFQGEEQAAASAFPHDGPGSPYGCC